MTWVPTAISAGSGILNALFGDKDKWQMSPESRALYAQMMEMLQKGEYGYSPADRTNMLANLKTGLGEQAQSRIGATSASLARRGMASPGQMAGMATDVNAAYGKAYGQGAKDIELGVSESKRQGKMDLMRMLSGLSGQSQFMPGQGVAGLGDLSQNLMLMQLLKKKNLEDEGSFSNMRAPSLWGR